MKVKSKCWRVAILSLFVVWISADPLTKTPRNEIDHRGYLFAEIETIGGDTYKGFLRWGSQEAFWDDYFNSSKGSVEFKQYIKNKQSEEPGFKVFDYTLSTSEYWPKYYRLFVAFFGDIKEIQPTGSQSAKVTMKSGTVHHVSGASDDVGATLRVQDPDFGEIEIPWRRIKRVVFQPGPKAGNQVKRLYGTVKSTHSVFKGFIQWDKQECLGTDKLDGNSADGRVSISMGKIRKIERRGAHSALVTLKNGRVMTLHDSSDIGRRNNGIYVADARYGRVEIAWDQLLTATFEDQDHTGRPYQSFPSGQTLKGEVTTTEGSTHSGQLIYDLDEKENWEFLNGIWESIEYDIPFRLISKIEPQGLRSTLVHLKNGDSITLEGKADVTSKNLGVLVETGTKEAVYIKWKKIQRIQFH